MADLYPDVKDFKRSGQWFKGFHNRKNVSLRKRTHATQHAPLSLRGALSKFHAKLFRVRRRRKFELSDIPNMDETCYHLSSTTAKPTTTKARKRSGVPLLLPDLINGNALSN